MYEENAAKTIDLGSNTTTRPILIELRLQHCVATVGFLQCLISCSTQTFSYLHRNEEGEEQLRLRRLQLPFNFATGEALLYETAPTIEIPDLCSAPKQRKLDNYSVSPDSLLGCMLRQDQSVYCEHNSANTFNTLNDVAFKDTHATVNVPGDTWQLPSPKPVVGSLLTSEDTVQDMMETLQQILGDNDFTETLDVEPDELKGWESMLLKMSTTSCDLGEELNDILSNDILMYVEEQLQKDGGLKLPDQLDDVPACLSTLDLHNQCPDQDGEQKFVWAQNQLVPNKGQMTTGQMTPGLGIMKLTHMDLSSASGLSGPTPQQIVSQQASIGLGNMGPPVTFNPSLMDSCTQAQNQMRTLQVNASDNNLGAFRQTNQLHSNQMAQPAQNPLQMRMPNFQVSLQDQSAERNLNPVFNIQGNQWNSSIQGERFVETYNQNISTQPGFTADPPLSSCLQGHFALQTQNSDNQRQSWPLQKQQLISSGPQQMGACLNQMSGFQRSPLPGVVAPQNPIKNRPMFSTPEMSSAPFTVQQDLEQPPLGPSSSCMFSNTTPSVPVNGVHHSQAPSCQRMNLAGNQIPSRSSCLYQGLPGDGSMKGVVAIPNPDEAALSCQMTTGLDANGLLVQQPYLNFSDETQVKKTRLISLELQSFHVLERSGFKLWSSV